MKTPNATILRRLAFVRYLYSLAVTQSRLPEPSSCVSLMTFQDAAEMFLHLAMEHVGAKAKTKGMTTFPEYIDLVDAELAPRRIEHRAAILNLNRARVALKHDGTIPARIEVERFRATATEFFEDNCPLVFGVLFDSLSLSLLVESPSGRSRMDVANTAISKGDYTAAIEHLAVAHHEIFGRFRTALNQRGYARGVVSEHQFAHLSSGNYISDRDTARTFEALSSFLQRAFAELEEDAEASRFGLDYLRFARFRSIIPHVTVWGSAVASVNFHHRPQPGKSDPTYTKEDAQFCFDFLIEAALRLQALQSELGVV